MSEEKKEFVVKDRRIFAGDGKDKEEQKAEKTPEEAKAKEQPPKREADQDKSKEQAAKMAEGGATAEEAAFDKKPEAETQLPEINFVTFVLSLNASALVNLGMVEDPATNTKVKNLPLAKQTIDILGMLQEKTRGNLSEDEENLIKHVLYELRMIYVKEKK